MNKWFEVLQSPEIMIPAIVSAFFTLLGAFGGVYFSNKHAIKLSRFNRLMTLNQELHEFKLVIEALESHIPVIHSVDKLDRLNKINLSIMIKKVEEEKLIPKIMNVKKPSTVDNQAIVNLISSLNSLEYSITEAKDDEIIYQAFRKYISEINSLKISLKESLKY